MERIAKQQERIKEVIRKSASNRETPRMQKKSLELFP